MGIYGEYEKKHPRERAPEGEFGSEPYDDYEKLRDILLDRFPDVTMRLKVNPKTGRMKLSSDVHSVFDIAWCTYATILAQTPALEDIGKEDAFQKVSLSPATTVESSLSVEITDSNIVITRLAKGLVRYKTNVISDAENAQKLLKIERIINKNRNKMAKPYGLHITAFHTVFFDFIILYFPPWYGC